MKTMSTNS